MTITGVVDAEPSRVEGEGPRASSRPWPNPLYAWYVVIMLVAAYGFAIIDRTAIGLMVDPIKHDLKISDSQVGLLQGLAFAICYTTFGIPLGFLADRGKRTPVLVAGIAVWSAATVACGFALNFGMLFLARVGVGVGEATVTPGSGSLIADYFPPAQRPKAYGVWMLGSSLGSALASGVVALAIVLGNSLHASGAPWAAHLRTWQMTFFLIGAPGLAVALLFALTVREPVRRGERVAFTGFPLRPLWETLKAKRGAYTALIGGAVLNVMCVYAQIGWMPSIYMRVFHWSPAKVGAMSAFVSLPIGMSGALIAGWTMSFLTSKGRRDAPILMAMGHSLSTLCFGTAACLAPRPELTLLLNALAAVTSTWSYAAAITGINQITPNELRGQMSAIYTLFTGLVSLTMGSFLVGLLTDTAFHGVSGIRFSLASVYVGCSLAAIVILVLGRSAYAKADAISRSADADALA